MHTTLDLISNEIPRTHPALFLTFIDTFRINDTFPYKSLHTRCILTSTYTISISLNHIFAYDSQLYDYILHDPTNAIQQFENALSEQEYKKSNKENSIENSNENNNDNRISNLFTLHFTTNLNHTPLRTLTSSSANRLVRIKGITLSCSVPFHVPQSLNLTCKKCLTTIFASSFVPRTCKAECGLDPYTINPEGSIVFDEQLCKIQEMFEDVPVGEMPRHVQVKMTKSHVDSIVPGTRVSLTGIVSVRQSAYTKKGTTSSMFLKVIGVEKMARNSGVYFTDIEKNAFNNVPRERLYPFLAGLLAPQIHGHTDIKKAILCMLIAGTRRSKHGANLRADINILLLGDPGIAKSQILKFTNTVMHGVYTSGKGSSAAGLTATVIKNKRGEFSLEGGALVLSDNGICCIDEFDKMDVNDRVSIHEAMEQQTVSINKAGINTCLNTRCGVLAAANPVFGRYDECRSFESNVDFGATILSRFDCVFVMRDREETGKDKRLARHIIDINTNITKSKDKDENDMNDTQDNNNINNNVNNNINNSVNNSTVSGEYELYGLGNIFSSPLDFLRKFIMYARSTKFPSLTQDAKNKLTLFYIQTRKENTGSSVPITVRQLESLIRLSEALAKMELVETAEIRHVDEAIRLFTVSTIDAVNKNYVVEGVSLHRNKKEDGNDIETVNVLSVYEVSEKIKTVLPVGMAVKYEKVTECVDVERGIFGKAVEYLVRQGKIELKDNGRLILRMF